MRSHTFTREEEFRMNALQERASVGELLSRQEEDELALLKRYYHEFLEEGDRRLRFGLRPSVCGSTGSGESTDVVDVLQNSAARAGKAAYFWGSLVATAVPGYLGRKMGITTSFLHWNFITDRLMLGAIPVVTQVGSSGSHLVQIRQQLASRGERLGLVVACLESDEAMGFGVNMISFASESAWRECVGDDVQYIRVPMEDTTANIPFEMVKNAVDRMHTCMARDERVAYVHCKAGKGRSWMLVICYLTTHAGMTFEMADDLVRSKRPQVNPSESQRAFAAQFSTYMMSRNRQH